MTSRGQLSLEEALQCPVCGNVADTMEECNDRTRYKQGEVLIIRCKAGCRQKPWFYCHPCSKKFTLSNLKSHSGSAAHIRAHELAHPTVPKSASLQPQPVVEMATQSSPVNMSLPAFPDSHSPLSVLPVNTEDMDVDADMDLSDIGDMQPIKLMAELDKLAAARQRNMPNMCMKGNNAWLAELMKDQPFATKDDLDFMFQSKEVSHMKNFWVAELTSGEGKCGGGAIYLAARAFQQARDSSLNHNIYPEYEEARFQLKLMIQYLQASNKQRSLNWELRGVAQKVAFCPALLPLAP